jgi:hypothetical protein
MQKSAADTQKKIIGQLKAELEAVTTLPVCEDHATLQPGDDYNLELARSLCQSVVMVMLYWPTYFSLDHSYCAREFKAMEKLEEERLKLLPEHQRSKKFIIILAIRGGKDIPSEIRHNRHVVDLLQDTLDPNMLRRRSFISAMVKVAEAIQERQQLLSEYAKDTRNDCSDCRLPEVHEVEPWLRQIRQNETPRAYPLTGF